MKDFCQYGNRRDDEWEILPWISRRTTPVKAGRLPYGSHPRAAQRARWAGLDRSRAAAYKAYKGETLTIRAERG